MPSDETVILTTTDDKEVENQSTCSGHTGEIILSASTS
jgi:hypothetical protein